MRCTICWSTCSSQVPLPLNAMTQPLGILSPTFSQYRECCYITSKSVTPSSPGTFDNIRESLMSLVICGTLNRMIWLLPMMVCPSIFRLKKRTVLASLAIAFGSTWTSPTSRVSSSAYKASLRYGTLTKGMRHSPAGLSLTNTMMNSVKGLNSPMRASLGITKTINRWVKTPQRLLGWKTRD